MQTHTANYKVRVSDAGADGKLKLPALLQMLQEIATEHAEILKVDFDTLRPQGLGWALSKIAAEIEKLAPANLVFEIPENCARVVFADTAISEIKTAINGNITNTKYEFKAKKALYE